ncbi:hypothetical protein [Sphingomonas sp. RS2018]
MQFLKTLLIVFTVALAVAFAFNNWDVVPVKLWSGVLLDINLPLLMLVCVLVGLVPTWLWQRAIRWRLAQRLTTSERALNDLRNVVATHTPAPVAEPVVATSPAPPLIDEPRA